MRGTDNPLNLEKAMRRLCNYLYDPSAKRKPQNILQFFFLSCRTLGSFHRKWQSQNTPLEWQHRVICHQDRSIYFSYFCFKANFRLSAFFEYWLRGTARGALLDHKGYTVYFLQPRFMSLQIVRFVCFGVHEKNGFPLLFFLCMDIKVSCLAVQNLERKGGQGGQSGHCMSYFMFVLKL